MSTLRTTKSIEALSASLNRALAGVRQPQVVAAQRALRRQTAAGALGSAPTHPTSPASPSVRAGGSTERLASRRRTNLMIGTLDGLRRSPASWNTARRGRLSGAG